MQTHQDTQESTRTTVTLPSWLYLHYKHQALESQVTFTEVIEQVLKSQVGKSNQPVQKKKQGFQSIIECAEALHKQYPEELKRVPPDISSNYKQYLYGGKK